MNKEYTAPNIFTAFDLELNQNIISGPRIIQIGAIVGNINTGEILERLSVFVNPQQILEPYIIELTKIKQEDVDNGVTLEEAVNQLSILHKKHNSFINPIVWGAGDVKAIKEELEPPLFVFGRREIDVKTLYCAYRIANGQNPSGGLAKAMTKFGLKFKGIKHRADCDAENTFIIFKHMLQYLKNTTRIGTITKGKPLPITEID